jgi:hypothetical protein
MCGITTKADLRGARLLIFHNASYANHAGSWRCRRKFYAGAEFSVLKREADK